jgi:hypothetical protein
VKKAALTLSVVMLALPASGATKKQLPANVTMIARGAHGATMSPDGATLAYFTGLGDRKIVLLAGGKSVTFDPKEKSCSDSACLDRRCSRLVWSADSRQIAYAVDGGLYVLDVAKHSARRLDATPTCDFDWAAGKLHWIDAAKEIHEDGVKKTAKLPAANFYELDGALVLSGKDLGYGEMQDVIVNDLRGAKVVSVVTKDRVFAPILSPSGDRLCWIGATTGVHCVVLATGKDTVLTLETPRFLRWGHDRDLPFSPSGHELAFPVERGNDDVMVVYDFTSAKLRDLAVTKHMDYGFQSEDRLLLYDDDGNDATIPALDAIDVATAAVHTLVGPDSEYEAPVPIPGDPHTLYMGRERPASGARDLVRVTVK